jgi:hypothetical protein
MLITLENIELDSPLDRSGAALVSVELVLPRPAIALRRALLEVPLRSGKRSMQRANFHEKALLKERVDGLFGLKVAITRPTPPSQFADVLRDILSTGIQNVGDILARMSFTTPPARRIAMMPTDAVADAIQDTSPMFIADGSLDLASDSLTSGILSVPLRLNKTVRESNSPSGPRNRPTRKATATQVFRKGTPVGTIQLRVMM